MIASQIKDLALARLKSRLTWKSWSWLRRCLRRLSDVEEDEDDPNLWRVKGRPELGDREPEYLVKLAAGRYYCTCYDPSKPYAKLRRREVCSHVGAVMLYREVKRLAGNA